MVCELTILNYKFFKEKQVFKILFNVSLSSTQNLHIN